MSRVETTYEGVHYMIPRETMGEWFAFMRDLSVFSKDCGNLQINFSDKFTKYKIMNVEISETQKWYASERKITIDQFDDYDAHVCRVANSYLNDILKEM